MMRGQSKLDRWRNAQGKIWLNVASSHYVLDGFVNLDSHVMMLALDYPLLARLVSGRNSSMLAAYREARAKATLLRHDCRKPLPLPDGSVDHILCSHFLEHVYPDEAVAILKDFSRALKPGATLHVIVPDLEVLARRYIEQRARGESKAADDFVQSSLLSTPSRGSLTYRALELSGGFGLQHRWMYDGASMRERVAGLGFDIVPTNSTPSHHFRHGDDSVHIVAHRPVSKARPARAGPIPSRADENCVSRTAHGHDHD